MERFVEGLTISEQFDIIRDDLKKANIGGKLAVIVKGRVVALGDNSRELKQAFWYQGRELQEKEYQSLDIQAIFANPEIAYSRKRIHYDLGTPGLISGFLSKPSIKI